MEHAEHCSKPHTPDPAPGRVSIRAIYRDALREVLADPQKAIAEHDPWLALLLPRAADTTAKR
jgi:hypothetical protein